MIGQMNRRHGFLLAGLVSFLGSASGKPPLLTPPEVPLMGEMDPYLLKTLYAEKNKDTGLEEIVGEKRFQELVKKWNVKLFGGPILGCVTDESAKVWVRTPGPGSVQVVGEGFRSEVIKTTAKKDFTGIMNLGGLKPLTSYSYDVLVNGESVYGGEKPEFRTFPKREQKARFHVGFGGCARYNSPKEGIWNVVASYDPLAFLFLGDNVYMDVPEHRTQQRVHYYRRQLRPEFQNLTRATAIYSIYDDHDLGKNDTSGGPKPFKPDWKYASWKVFKENWNNPAYGQEPERPGCWYNFSIGDVDFFMLDGRYYRDFKKGTMMGPDQKAWLLDKLGKSKATFKVIACGTLWTKDADKGGKDSWWGVKEEREEIFSLIDEKKLGGVILLSSDRHRTDVYKIERPKGYDIYEFETGKITNIHTHNTNKKALFSYNKGNFFGLLDFDLTKKDPEVTFKCVTLENKTVYDLTLKRSQLESR